MHKGVSLNNARAIIAVSKASESAHEENWACAQTYPLQEARALRHLKQQKFEAFFPFFFSSDKRGTQVRIRPLFPGYIFVDIPDTRRWTVIQNTRGILKLLTTTACGDGYRQPVRMPKSFIDSLSRCFIPNKEYGELAKGTLVEIKGGSLEGRSAIVAWSENDRVGILLQMLGRQVEIEFAVDEVKEVK